MTTTTSTMTVREQLEQAAKIAGEKAWGADRGKPRIYFTSKRDRKVFISFDDCSYTS